MCSPSRWDSTVISSSRDTGAPWPACLKFPCTANGEASLGKVTFRETGPGMGQIEAIQTVYGKKSQRKKDEQSH